MSKKKLQKTAHNKYLIKMLQFYSMCKEPKELIYLLF